MPTSTSTSTHPSVLDPNPIPAVVANISQFGDDSGTSLNTKTADGSHSHNAASLSSDKFNQTSNDLYTYPDNDDDTPLPFPAPLSRPSFLTTTFDPHTFLSSLSTSNRFQTLEDLASELRELSANISRELVDLVNGNYAAFVALGGDLRGGDERVEEIRVGLLGFEKEVKGLRGRVVERREEVARLVGEKREVRRLVGIGRGLVEVEERIGELEGLVGLTGRRRSVVDQNAGAKEEDEEAVEWSADWDEQSVGVSDEEVEDEDGDVGVAKTRVLVDKYLILKVLVKKFDAAHPFLVAQRERLQRVQDRVRKEVETAIVGADELAVKQKLIQMRAQMDD